VLEQRLLLSAISVSAVPLIGSLEQANGSSFFVYRNSANSPYNHGFPSGLFADSSATLAKIHVDPAAVDDPSAPSGYTTDPNALDTGHGNVLRVTFDPLAPGQFAGVNIEEPEDYGKLLSGVGYDLTGATTLSFDVRSPDGASVQFGVGGKVTTFMTIPASTTYTNITIPLASLRDPDSGMISPPDLTNVHLLFSVSTNDVNAPNGATLLVDNLQFTPTPGSQQQRALASLPLADETFGVVPASQVPFPPDQVLANVATTYETAMAIFTLLQGGTTADLASARAMENGLVYAVTPGNDNAGDAIPPAPGVDGATGLGLHNGFFAGDLVLYNDQNSAAGELGKKGQVRLAGFSVPAASSGSHFDLLLDGATGGNNAFAIMALLDGYERFGDPSYLNAALNIGRWIVGNLTDTSGTGYGGYYQGYPDMGLAKVLQTGKSVENNADIYAAFSMLAQFESTLGDGAAAALWTTRANIAGDFVVQMFDPTTGRFFAGTIPSGPGGPATGPGLEPDTTNPNHHRGNDYINLADFLDSATFTTLALAASPRYQNMIDWRVPMRHVLATFAQAISATSVGQTRTYQGFDLVPTPTPTADHPNSNPPNGIAWEFTAQAVETMKFVDNLYGTSEFAESIDLYLGQIRQAQQFAPFGDGRGLVASTLDGENDGSGGYPPVLQWLVTPFQGIAERVGLAATAWAVAADQGINVFRPLEVISATALRVSATEGAPIHDGQVASFSASDVGHVAGDFTAAIDWGDGTSSQGAVSGGNGSFVVTGSHTFGAEGQLTTMVTITDDAPGSITSPAVSTATVGEGDVLINPGPGAARKATEGQDFVAQLSFGDRYTANTASDFGATVIWGDGSSSAGAVSGSTGSFLVSASHTYADEGSFPVTVIVNDNGPGTASTTLTATVNVDEGDSFTGRVGRSIGATEGTSFSGVVASFTGAGPQASSGKAATGFAATIDWGDGTTSKGTVFGANGKFVVSGRHTYIDESRYRLMVTLKDVAPGIASATATGIAVVAEGDRLVAKAITIRPRVGVGFSLPVAVFSDRTYPGNSAGDFIATIDWGDGTKTAGTVQGKKGTFTVVGNHSYSRPGTFRVSVMLRDDGPGTASSIALSSATVGRKKQAPTASTALIEFDFALERFTNGLRTRRL